MNSNFKCEKIISISISDLSRYGSSVEKQQKWCMAAKIGESGETNFEYSFHLLLALDILALIVIFQVYDIFNIR